MFFRIICFIIGSLTLVPVFMSRSSQKRVLYLTLTVCAAFLFSIHGYIKDSPGLHLYISVGLLSLMFFCAVTEIFSWKIRRNDSDSYFKELRKKEGMYMDILRACSWLSGVKKGSLIVIQRNNPLDQWIETGVVIDSEISQELIASIFSSPSALHDGALIISGNRIISGGCLMPLSKNSLLPRHLGTRHRAAVGISEVTDALVLVNSEEESAVSIAYQGGLYYDLCMDSIPEVIAKLLKGKKPDPRLLVPQKLAPHKVDRSSVVEDFSFGGNLP